MGLEKLKSVFNDINIDVNTGEDSSRFESLDTVQDNLNGFQFSPISVLLSNGKYEQYLTDTPGAPLLTPTNLDYNSAQYDPRLGKKVTNFQIGQNNIEINSKNDYLGTFYDDEQTIGPTDVPYFAKEYVFNTDRPNPLISFNNNYPLAPQVVFEGQRPDLFGFQHNPFMTIPNLYMSSTPGAPTEFVEGAEFDYRTTKYDPRIDRATQQSFNSQNTYQGSAKYTESTLGPASSDTNSGVSHFKYDRTFSTDNSILATLPEDSEITVNIPNFTFTNNPQSFFKAPGTDTTLEKISEHGDEGDKSIQFSKLYGNDHTAKQLKVDLNPGIGVDKSHFDIRRDSSRTFAGKEPYIVTNIGSDTVSGRSLPFSRSKTDIKRLSNFLFSKEGINFFLKQNLLGANSYVQFSNKDILGERKLYSSKQRVKSYYLQSSTLAASTRLLGNTVPNVLVDREFPISEISNFAGGLPGPLGDMFPNKYTDMVPDTNKFLTSPSGAGFWKKSLQDLKNKVGAVIGKPSEVIRNDGDRVTLQKVFKSDHLTPQNDWLVTPDNTSYLEREEYGMPFYFKDLRSNTYIIFRAYIDGLTESVTPSWNSETYIGRSEPVYTYGNAERTISFNLKLMAQTEEELKAIYAKMNMLTSLCYPSYPTDDVSITRMNPPLLKFRLGELYGNSEHAGVKTSSKTAYTKFFKTAVQTVVDTGQSTELVETVIPNDWQDIPHIYSTFKQSELMGFLDSLTYTVPDSSPWETKRGQRVPKYVEASINYKVIHNKTPQAGTQFIGFTGKNAMDNLFSAAREGASTDIQI